MAQYIPSSINISDAFKEAAIDQSEANQTSEKEAAGSGSFFVI